MVNGMYLDEVGTGRALRPGRVRCAFGVRQSRVWRSAAGRRLSNLECEEHCYVGESGI